MKRSALAFTIAATLAGCGNTPVNPMPDGGGCTTGAQYPCGPFGYGAGSVIADLKLSGRHDDNGNGSPADDMLHDIHFSDYHQNAAAKVLVVLVAAEWCQPCKTEQSSLVATWNGYQMNAATKDQVPFLESIVQDSASNVAGIANVDNWTTTYKIPFDMAADPDQALKPYYNVMTFPSQMVIRTSDMKIQWQNNGLAGAELKNQIDLALAN